MKNIFKYAFLIIGIALFSSCSKEDVPMTSTVELAGEWAVTVDAVVDGEVIEDPYNLGSIMMLTFNTNKDDGNEIYVTDLAGFWDFKVKVPCAVSSLTFGSSTPAVNEVKDYAIAVTLTDGKVTPKGAVTPSGMPADGIEFRVTFEDDDPGIVYYIHGYRRTGFVADE